MINEIHKIIKPNLEKIINLNKNTVVFLYGFWYIFYICFFFVLVEIAVPEMANSTIINIALLSIFLYIFVLAIIQFYNTISFLNSLFSFSKILYFSQQIIG